METGKDTRMTTRARWIACLALLAVARPAWRGLIAAVRALRGPSDMAGAMAHMVLAGMARQDGHRVRAPAEDDLRALLGGTNLFAWLDVLAALAATGLEPELARRLIPASRDLVVGNLRSKNPTRRWRVQSFLAGVTGAEPGEDPEAWVRWVEALQPLEGPGR